MKKITLLLGAIVTASVGFSQIILDVKDAPSCTNLLGVKQIPSATVTMADTDGSDAGWGQAYSMFEAINAVEAPLMLVDDGNDNTVDANGNNTNWDACDSVPTFTQDLTGKIAVCVRGACEFGLKAYNCEKQGAVAVIIVNHTGDAVGMAGGTYGPEMTIPVIMVSETFGDEIIACLDGGGDMTAFIGSKVGLFADDMGTSPADIVLPENASTPMTLTNVAANDIDLGFWAYNLGRNDMNGVTGSVDVMYMGSSVYSNTSSALNFVSPDTSYIDTQYIDLGTFTNAMGTMTGGKYTVTYTLNTPVTDEAMADNEFSFDFWISPDNIYSKSRVDMNYMPIYTTAYSLNESTTSYDDFESCVQFDHPNASSLNAMGMTFSCQPVGEIMANEIIEVRAYTWDDNFTDLNDAAFPGSTWALTQVGSALHFYIDESEDGVNITLPFNEAPIAMTDNQRYLFCVYNASDSLRIGYDAQIDYTSTVNNYLEASSPVKTLENGAAAQWFAAGFGYDVSTAVTVDFDETPVSVQEEANNVAAPAYPNPAANLLNVPVRTGVAGNVAVEVMDVTGKVVLVDNQVIGANRLEVNVAGIANGSYVFKLTFADGSTDTFKVSVNR